MAAAAPPVETGMHNDSSSGYHPLLAVKGSHHIFITAPHPLNAMS